MNGRMKVLSAIAIGMGLAIAYVIVTRFTEPSAKANAQAPPDAERDAEHAATALATRVGKLEFTHDFANGFPTHATVAKLYDEIDFQRACQAYLWALPVVSFATWQRVHEQVFGAHSGDMVSYANNDDKQGILTANATTPYLSAFANLTETGPLVVEMPPTGTYGGHCDYWQRPLPEQTAPGAPKPQGSTYLLLAPGQEQPGAEGYRVLRSPTNNVFFGFRVLAVEPKQAKAIVDRLRVYPYAMRHNPPPTRIVSPGGKAWSATPPRGLSYWERLAEVIDKEPVHERDRFFMAMLRPLGIEKGKRFAPDERQQKILTDAALVGEAMAKANTFDKRAGEPYYANARWKLALILDPSQRADNYDQLDERAAWFYEAVTASKAMATKMPGTGSVYLGGYQDKDGDWFDGGQSYRLRIPAKVPTMLFWSVTLYDVDTRCFIKNKEKIADRSSRMDLVKNDDQSVDIYFGPTAPAGFEKNWIPTTPGKGWFAYFRLFLPTAPYFDKSWQLPDIEKVK